MKISKKVYYSFPPYFLVQFLLYKVYLIAVEVQESTNCHNFSHNHSEHILFYGALHAIQAPKTTLVFPTKFALKKNYYFRRVHRTIRGARRKIEGTEPTSFRNSIIKLLFNPQLAQPTQIYLLLFLQNRLPASYQHIYHHCLQSFSTATDNAIQYYEWFTETLTYFFFSPTYFSH